MVDTKEVDVGFFFLILTETLENTQFLKEKVIAIRKTNNLSKLVERISYFKY